MYGCKGFKSLVLLANLSTIKFTLIKEFVGLRGIVATGIIPFRFLSYIL